MYTATNAQRASELLVEYSSIREHYVGTPLSNQYLCDTELVSDVITKLKRGRAAGLDGLTAEHLLYCHPILSCVLSKLFNLMIVNSYVPAAFGYSYTVPLSKVSDCRTKALTCNDFRGIAISAIISKTFEYCILERFEYFFLSKDNQFGFKKRVGCTHAVYSARKTIERYVAGGSTVNICSLDLSKAFDRVNHHALLIKLMKRRLPTQLLDVFVNWFDKCYSCVRWDGLLSHFYRLKFGVRQGSVLSPYLFAVYLDDIIDHRANYLHNLVIIYADDILLLAQSLRELQIMVANCERELIWLDMCINVKKSCCMRIGPRCNVSCNSITTVGGTLPWVNNFRYLGIVLVQSRNFRCSLSDAKKSFYRSLNAIFGRIGRQSSEEVVLQLMSSKCLPILLYGLEACPLNKSDLNSLDFAVNRFLMKLFNTINVDIIAECRSFFNVPLPSCSISHRADTFVKKYSNCGNALCKILAGIG